MRKSGILMHISSLPSRYGIGTLGAEAYRFIDFLVQAGQHYWQVLPISPTGFGDSPYSSFSSYAGNPYFVDFELLSERGLLIPEEYTWINWGDEPEKTDYGTMYNNRFNVLIQAAKRLFSSDTSAFNRFCLENSYWLEDYSLFMALKDAHGGKSWTDWDVSLRLRDESVLQNAREEHRERTGMYKAIQYFFYCQWRELKDYAQSKGIEIIGDIPIYVAPDSADVWAHPEVFQLDEFMRPPCVSGCPPDGFTQDGQLWGNPLYNWDAVRDDDFDWWLTRIDHQFRQFDVLRIDHFRGFDSYYSIPAREETARNGVWRKGPGMELFDAVGDRRIIAEDLGYLTDSVRRLLADTGYPGMKVLQFAFDSREESDYLPHNFTQNSAAYTGTHDNNTILGWFASAPEEDVRKARAYMRMTEKDDPAWVMLNTLWSSVADTAIACMQDLLGLDDSARMNTPGIPDGNWRWRMRPDAPLDEVAAKLRDMTALYGRL
jgi:4-alpha-glucanotransferase